MKKEIVVKGISLNLFKINNDDFVSILDMIKAKDGNYFISDWLRNRNTIEFLGFWEKVNNPNFNCGEFDIIKSKAGLNNYRLSVKDWVEKTNAIGIFAKTGRYGGTYRFFLKTSFKTNNKELIQEVIIRIPNSKDFFHLFIKNSFQFVYIVLVLSGDKNTFCFVHFRHPRSFQIFK